MKKQAILLITIFFILAGFAACFADEMKVEVFEVKYRDAKSLKPAVEHLKSPEGKVTVDGHTGSLIVVDHLENLKMISQIIAQLDVPEKQIEIKVMVAEVTSAVMRRAGLLSGEAVIPPERFREVEYLINNSDTSNVKTRMTVKTMSGRPAVIRVAEEELFGGTTVLHQGRTYISPLVERSAGNFLEVLPKANNDGTITVVLRPEVSEFREDRTIDERSVLTQVIVNSGDTIVIGGMDREERRKRGAEVPFTGVSAAIENSEDTRRVVMFLTAVLL